MNPTPAPEADGPLTSQQRGHDLPEGPLAVESTTVPRQKAGCRCSCGRAEGPHGATAPGPSWPGGGRGCARTGPAAPDR
ncbi:hypothetical protein DLE01_22530 [Streptomyces sp. FT05W]|nr:hypothetical protein DLE01_22530 [Streptomyces sp. FT05W]